MVLLAALAQVGKVHRDLGQALILAGSVLSAVWGVLSLAGDAQVAPRAIWHVCQVVQAPLLG
eukprot:4326757-Alexandrium_andersonii.AAC.1